MKELCPNQSVHSTTRLALHPDGTPMISIGPAVDLSEPSPALDPEHSRQCMAAPPPAAGEVAELVKWLRAFGDEQLGLHREDPDAYRFARAAELLERRQPQPVPVSERLPGPQDCDEMGRCWWYEDTEDCCGVWGLDIFDHEYTHWLPANALPLPTP